ncbi:lymphocyte antigen 6G6e-like [Neomonachus schauinslandi]|uniref:Lymphocyte antigen 6G6e-like n=1 Tax=Neomonachus schauinslandi TaxID=29088 RepID=A0A2Y9HLT2_NEOSC|nr:lymphocyte antigen 6G6e-like [Neomonachus schauinslandi]
MGTSSIFLCILFICGALGLTTPPPPPPARGRLRCYTCSFAKPCYPVATECQDDEACDISTGTSEQNEIIERKGCLPRAQCPLQGRATYWSRSYTLRHHCCEQDLCNTATTLQPLPSPLLTALLLLLGASFTWGGPLLRWLQAGLQPSTQGSAPIITAFQTPASEICPRT